MNDHRASEGSHDTKSHAQQVAADRAQPGTKQGDPADGLRESFTPEKNQGPHGKSPQIDKNKLPARDTATKYDGNHNDAGQRLSNVLPHPQHPDGRSIETAMPPKPFVGNGEMQHIDDSPVSYNENQRLHRLELRLREVCEKLGLVYDPEEKERVERDEKRLSEAKKDDRGDLKYATNTPAPVAHSSSNEKRA